MKLCLSLRSRRWHPDPSLQSRRLHSILSPRSGRQHKAWGVSPRIEAQNILQPVKRATDLKGFELSPAIAGSRRKWHSYLGLPPQALCRRPLRGLKNGHRLRGTEDIF